MNANSESIGSSKNSVYQNALQRLLQLLAQKVVARIKAEAEKKNRQES